MILIVNCIVTSILHHNSALFWDKVLFTAPLHSYRRRRRTGYNSHRIEYPHYLFVVLVDDEFLYPTGSNANQCDKLP